MQVKCDMSGFVNWRRRWGLVLDWVRNRCFKRCRMLPGSKPAAPGTSQFLLFWQFTKTLSNCMNTRSLTSRECTKGKIRSTTKGMWESMDEGKMMERTKAFGQSGLVCERPRNGVSRFPPKRERGLLLTYTTFNQGWTANLLLFLLLFLPFTSFLL